MNKEQGVALVAKVAAIGAQAYRVQSDPSVRTAAAEFGAEVKRLNDSGRRLAREINQSWRRQSDRGLRIV